VRDEIASWLEWEREETRGVGRVNEACEKGKEIVSLFVSFGLSLGKREYQISLRSFVLGLLERFSSNTFSLFSINTISICHLVLGSIRLLQYCVSPFPVLFC